MKMSWRDIFSTIFAIAVAVVLTAKLRSYDWAFLGSWKGAIGALGVLGLMALLVDESDFSRLNTWGALEGVVALVGVGFLVAGLIVASKTMFVALAISILTFWFLSLLRHGLSHEPALHRPTTQ